MLDEMVARSTAHEDSQGRVAIFIRSPEQAHEILSRLVKALGAGAGGRIAILTGTIRGQERDALMQDPPQDAASRVVRHFLDGTRPERAVYLISTSAGEVGTDLDADHMVCDAAALDSLIQRLGRVNRRGSNPLAARIDVVGVAPEPADMDPVASTFRILDHWGARATGVDVAPRHLSGLLNSLPGDERARAFPRAPQAVPLTESLLDDWALTSVQDMPARPAVAPFLHGLTSDPPHTFVAWRREICLLDATKTSDRDLGAWFRACRLESRELARDQTSRVRKVLDALLKGRREVCPDLDFPAVILDERGRARRSTLSKAVKDEDLEYRTLVLPVEAGGLDGHGMLAADALPSSALDVAEWGGEAAERQRWLSRRTAEGEWFERIATGEGAEALPSTLRVKARVSLEQQGEDGGDEATELLLLLSPQRSALSDPETTSACQRLEDHGQATAATMHAIAKPLRLPPPVQDALVLAARWHDRGKDRRVWQRYACNSEGGEVLAKSVRYLHPRALGGYRHEFGSLLEAIMDPDIARHPERDLVLHLISAHHGWARPHFEPQAYDHERFESQANERAVLEAMQRFGRLQQRFGRWGLAWLESLVRCADICASRQAATAPLSVTDGKAQL